MDPLLYISRTPWLRNLVQLLRLPLPIPPELGRPTGNWPRYPLLHKHIKIGGRQGRAHTYVAPLLANAGAHICLNQDSHIEALYRHSQNKVGHLTLTAPALVEQTTLSALLFDATGLDQVDQLDELHTFFHEGLARLQPGGRIVILSQAAHANLSANQRAVISALGGFTRTLSKELGRRGIGVQMLQGDAAAFAQAAIPLSFFLSPYSSYISGQQLRLHAYTNLAPTSSSNHGTQPLTRQVALVTGASRGIGLAITERLHSEGAQIIALDHPSTQADLNALQQRLGMMTLATDLLQPDHSIEQLSHYLEQQQLTLDIVVHNAGITRDRTLAKMDQARWQQVVQINLASIIQLQDALEPQLNDHARIICMASVSGIAGNFGQSNYATSKAGVIGYVEGLAHQLSPRAIRVNAIAPGFIETAMTAKIPAVTREFARRANAFSQGGLPSDIARAASFLAHPQNILTGQTLRVCGHNLLGV